MKANSPPNYICPICLGNQGIENRNTLLKQADLIFRDDLVCAWINSFWIKGNEGHVIVVPNEHFENLYDLPINIGHRIFNASQMMSKVIKQAYGCDGITLRQNNEPAGDQHAFHYHLHIFPRYSEDSFNQNIASEKVLSKPSQRTIYVQKLKLVLNHFIA